MARPDFLTTGEEARLIPVTADSNHEQRLTSILLAGMKSIYELRVALLKSIGVRVGSRAELETWTEVTFKNIDKGNKTNDRPDGLLILKTGRKEWKALVEAKVGTAELNEDQVARYLDQAKKNGVDAVITISNQFAALPTHHPVKVSKVATRNVDLFHWSWSFVRTQCAVLKESDGVKDADQAFILNEILRYFDSGTSGISQFVKMNKEWTDMVVKVAAKSPLNKTSDEVQNTVAAWHQEQRDVCLILSRLTLSDVTLRLSREHRTDPAKRIRDESEQLCKTGQLFFSLDVPNAAAPLDVMADVGSRMLICSMKLQAPQDKKSTKAKVNWLIKQLKKTEASGFHIQANRPGRSQPTIGSLAAVRDDATLLEADDSNVVANSLEVRYRIDLAGRFSKPKVFIEELEKAVPHFYEQAGQWLKAWTPSAPKIEKPEKEDGADPNSKDVEDGSNSKRDEDGSAT